MGLVAAVVLWSAGGGAARAEQDAGKTRAASLRVLQKQLRAAAGKGQRPRELYELCGITRVLGYVVDEDRRDLILLGEVRAQAPPLHAEDLAVALRSAWLRYSTRRGQARYYQNPGCSIDPDPSVVQRLSQVGSAEIDEEQMDAWCDICDEPQQVRVMGVPFDSRFARVMVEADYRMKSLADGSVEVGVSGFSSLSDLRYAMAEQDLAQNRRIAPTLSLNRFWFFPGETRFAEQEGVVTIERCPVVLLTEEQRLTREGLTGLKRADPVAKQFAEEFGRRYADIAGCHVIYRELEELFRLVSLAKLAQYQRLRVDLDYLLDRFPLPGAKVPRTLPGISRVRKLEREREIAEGHETTTLWMPSCGGVNMDIQIGPHNFKRAPAPKAGSRPKATGGKKSAAGKKAAILKSRPSPDVLYWDLDPKQVRIN